MADKHYTHQVAELLRAEVLANAKSVAAALAPPDDAADGKAVPRAQFIEHVRVMSQQDPTYLARLLDQLAPASIPGPGGVQLRAEIGLDNFLELVHEARPDIYVRVMLQQPA